MDHLSVMSDEVMEYLLHEKTRSVLDGTIGAGGHAYDILSARSDVSVVGVDRDPVALAIASRRLSQFGDRATLVRGVFADLAAALGPEGMVDGVFLDLGLSSMQLNDASRGFSHSNAGPLDMRMGDSGETVEAFIDRCTENELAATIKRFGEVRGSHRIARRIKRAREEERLVDTLTLREVITEAVGVGAAPALMSQIFQAFRIAINDELVMLDRFLSDVVNHVNPGGRIVIISYHSLEDRAVKQFFRQESASCICPPEVPVCVCNNKPRLEVLTRRAVKASPEEVSSNSRSRSARLRAALVLEKEAIN